MKTRTNIFRISSLLTIGILLSTLSVYCKTYPDSIMQASAGQYRINRGFNLEIAGGAGLGRYEFGTAPAHVENRLNYPTWNIGLGVNWYFVSWMGIGTGLQFSTYTNSSAINKPWVMSAFDYQGESYTLTSTPINLTEKQTIGMLEVPLALKFRAMPRNVGFLATAGMKFGIPMYNRYRLADGGYFDNSVYYEHWSLNMHDVPSVIEDWNVTGSKSSVANSQFLNFSMAATAEIGMLFRLHRQIDLSLSLFGNYYFTSISHRNNDELGFLEFATTGEYVSPFTTTYAGVLSTNEVESLHPWSAGLKLGLHFNAGKTDAQRAYDKEQRERRREERQQMREEQRRQREEERQREAEEREQRRAEVEEVVPVIPVAPVYDEPTPRDKAKKKIEELADEYGISLCDDCIPVYVTDTVIVHDTIVVHDTLTVVLTDTMSCEQLINHLDSMLQASVIYFHFDDTVPILEPEDILINIAAFLRQYPQQKIYVDGHACKMGKAWYNRILAMQRAKAVAERLRQLGVKDNQMLVRSLGSDEPYRYNNQHQLSKDRRVEIIPIRGK
ncbi:MAG: OmpA family protein [Paludibacteraceae bacterium]|nr:OmpA family protein [Paludibacteraceae bacterium]